MATATAPAASNAIAVVLMLGATRGRRETAVSARAESRGKLLLAGFEPASAKGQHWRYGQICTLSQNGYGDCHSCQRSYCRGAHAWRPQAQARRAKVATPHRVNVGMEGCSVGRDSPKWQVRSSPRPKPPKARPRPAYLPEAPGHSCACSTHGHGGLQSGQGWINRMLESEVAHI